MVVRDVRRETPKLTNLDFDMRIARTWAWRDLQHDLLKSMLKNVTVFIKEDVRETLRNKSEIHENGLRHLEQARKHWGNDFIGLLFSACSTTKNIFLRWTASILSQRIHAPMWCHSSTHAMSDGVRWWENEQQIWWVTHFKQHGTQLSRSLGHTNYMIQNIFRTSINAIWWWRRAMRTVLIRDGDRIQASTNFNIQLSDKILWSLQHQKHPTKQKSVRCWNVSN